MSMGLLRWYSPDANFRRVASRRLHAHFPEESEQVWRSTHTWRSRLAPNRPRHSASVNLMIRYLEWSCALADYFKDQGVPELTAHAACNLDYCAARELGVDLVRSQIIADGAEHCDFRWVFSTHGERSEETLQT